MQRVCTTVEEGALMRCESCGVEPSVGVQWCCRCATLLDCRDVQCGFEHPMRLAFSGQGTTPLTSTSLTPPFSSPPYCARRPMTCSPPAMLDPVIAVDPGGGAANPAHPPGNSHGAAPMTASRACGRRRGHAGSPEPGPPAARRGARRHRHPLPGVQHPRGGEPGAL